MKNTTLARGNAIMAEKRKLQQRLQQIDKQERLGVDNIEFKGANSEHGFTVIYDVHAGYRDDRDLVKALLAFAKDDCLKRIEELDLAFENLKD